MERSIDPIVSTQWLEDHLDDDLVIIDIRWAEHYEAGHIPGAISVPFHLVSDWADSGELIMELPPVEELLKTIGDCGITAGSRVVVVGPPAEPGVPPYALGHAVRVAATLMYAGVSNVAVLSGSHATWSAEGRETETAVPKATPVPYSSAVDSDTWVSTEYVKEHIGKAVLIDGRDPDVYFGVSIEEMFADMQGHIPTARCLPMVWAWEADGTYKPFKLIESMAVGVIGEDKGQEVIAYCGAGGYASAWWFLLTQLLGYTNVKIYDGSMEAWAEEDNPVVAYTWTA
jgi:thiosulfate/3-mercaptopyruvate sulfurtransferase